MNWDQSVVIMAVLYPTMISALAINLLDADQLMPHEPNYCNDTSLLEGVGLTRAPIGQFLGYPCSGEFYHCRWQSDGFRTYKKTCKMGLVYDTIGTQNCNFDFNIKGCGLRSDKGDHCTKNEFGCPLSEKCVPLSLRCDGKYDCMLEEDEQNCPMCSATEFPCVISEQCIPNSGRCNGIPECSDGTDELGCDVCGMGMFHCLKSAQCIPMAQRCDGVPQCTQGEDEHLCKAIDNKQFVCENRVDRIPMIQVCDQVADCPDGSDEKYCLPGQNELPAAANGQLPVGNNVYSTADYGTETDEYEGDDVLPVSPLMPIARFTPRAVPPPPSTLPPTTTTTTMPTTTTTTTTTPIPTTVTTTTTTTTTTTQPPTTVTTTTVAPIVVPQSVPVTPSVPVNPHPQYPFPPPGIQQSYSVSTVAVTAPPARPYPALPGASQQLPPLAAAETVPTSAPVPSGYAPNPVSSNIEDDQELLLRLGKRFGGKGNLNARDILSKLESILSEPNTPPQQSPLQASNPVKLAAPTYSRIPPKTLRVTGRPTNARKWRPSLSVNPNHRTTPLPSRGENYASIQFRQSDALKATSVRPQSKTLAPWTGASLEQFRKSTEDKSREATLAVPTQETHVTPISTDTAAEDTSFTDYEHTE